MRNPAMESELYLWNKTPAPTQPDLLRIPHFTVTFLFIAMIKLSYFRHGVLSAAHFPNFAIKKFEKRYLPKNATIKAKVRLQESNLRSARTQILSAVT